MEGEDTEEAGDNPRAFNNKKWWQKIIILLAGAAMNVLIAFLALAIVAGVGGTVTSTLSNVTAGGPAEEAGILAGDTIVAIDEVETESWADVVTTLDDRMSDGSVVVITVDRDGEEQSFDVTPSKNENGEYKVGIEASIEHRPGSAIKNGLIATKELIGALFTSFRDLFKSGDVMEQVSGPIGMVQVVNESRSLGGLYFVYLVAVISLNLAIFNLLPFPALDGGRIIFVIIRMITGKAISDTVEGRVHAVGMVLLITFAIFIAGNDIMKLIGR